MIELFKKINDWKLVMILWYSHEKVSMKLTLNFKVFCYTKYTCNLSQQKNSCFIRKSKLTASQMNSELATIYIYYLICILTFSRVCLYSLAICPIWWVCMIHYAKNQILFLLWLWLQLVTNKIVIDIASL